MKIILTFLISFTLTYSLVAQTTSEEQESSGAEVIRRYGLCVFPTRATRINGLCLAFSHNKPRKINGVNIDFPGARFTEYMIYMMSRDIYADRFASVNGLTVSFNPIYNKVNGLGIFIFITEIYTFNGVIIGTLNRVKDMQGVQIGFTNDATDGRLVQFGILNTIASNPYGLRTLPILNLRFKKHVADSTDKK
ncbi:MAG: hypothetical protein V4590_11825 [Bacteroidota bacterium]